MRAEYAAAALQKFRAYLEDVYGPDCAKSFYRQNVSLVIAAALLKKLDQWWTEDAADVVLARMLDALNQMHAYALSRAEVEKTANVKYLTRSDGSQAELPGYYGNVARFTATFRGTLRFLQIRAIPLWEREKAGLRLVNEAIPDWHLRVTQPACEAGVSLIDQLLDLDRFSLARRSIIERVFPQLAMLGGALDDNGFDMQLYELGLEPQSSEHGTESEKQLGMLWWSSASQLLREFGTSPGPFPSVVPSVLHQYADREVGWYSNNNPRAATMLSGPNDTVRYMINAPCRLTARGLPVVLVGDAICIGGASWSWKIVKINYFATSGKVTRLTAEIVRILEDSP